ncbi:hypothetical protein [Aurantiacibacter hainanensis]|uniref:hypothetical protein n=1 Tax=Aurantiacibacter hainanensis TaxID=3076114 RepID=UPI0030C6B7B2
MAIPDFEASQLFGDPASALLGFGAVAALLAVPYWVKVGVSSGRLISANGHGARRALGAAALLTALALALCGGGYLYGRLNGRF